MSVKIKYFVHGTTVDNELKLAAGWNDVKLSKKGIEQTIELGKQVNKDEIDIIISSDLTRAVESAKNIFPNKDIIKDSRIRECNYGDLNGLPSSNVIYEEHIYDEFINGESLIDVEKRMIDFCNYLLDNYDNKTVALISHRAPQLALDVITNNLSWEEAIKRDWRKTKAWQPGWTYILHKK